MTREEIIAKVSGKEINHKQIEGAIVNMFKNFNVDNTVVANRLLYGNILSFGFLPGDEAVELLDILLDMSSFELSELAKTVVPVSVIEFYEKMVEVEYLTSMSVVNTAMLDGVENLESAIEEAEKALEGIEDKFSN